MMHDSTRKRIRLAAVEYAEKYRLAVFPADISKPPVKKSFKSAEFSNGARWGASNNPKQVQWDFWKFQPDAIGIPTGKKNKVFVVDADTPKVNDVDGLANLQALIDVNAPLPETRMARSPSGSEHYYFRYPDQGLVRNTEGELAPGVDVRGEGGMVIAPPSVRPDGKEYKWVKEITVAPAPQWLLDLVVTKNDDANHEHEPGEPTAPFGKIAEALRLLSNDENSQWQIVDADGVVVRDFKGTKGWTEILMSIFVGTGGSDAGFEITDQWCRKNTAEYKTRETLKKIWYEQFAKSPPTRTTIATLFAIVEDEHPGWQTIWNEENPVELALWNAEHPNENTAVDIDTKIILAAAALENLPPPTEWDDCNYIGKATHSATDGAVEGFEAWYRWIARAGKTPQNINDWGHAQKTWLAYFKAPPNEIGLATLLDLANQGDPNWRDKLSEEFWQRVVAS